MKSLATAYMTRKFAKGRRVKAVAKPESEAPEAVEMCEHGGQAMCSEGCYVEDESNDVEVDGDLDKEMDSPEMASDDEEGEGLEDVGAKKFAKGGAVKSSILGKILGKISKMHRAG